MAAEFKARQQERQNPTGPGMTHTRCAEAEADVTALIERLERAEEIVRDVAAAGIVLDDPRLGYVEIQIAPQTLADARSLLAAYDGAGPMTTNQS